MDETVFGYFGKIIFSNTDRLDTKNILIEAAYFEPRSIRSTSKKLNLEVGMSTSIVVEQAMTYLKEAMQKRNVDSIKAAELLRWWLSDFQDEELEHFEIRVDLAKKVMHEID